MIPSTHIKEKTKIRSMKEVESFGCDVIGHSLYFISEFHSKISNICWECMKGDWDLDMNLGVTSLEVAMGIRS